MPGRCAQARGRTGHGAAAATTGARSRLPRRPDVLRPAVLQLWLCRPGASRPSERSRSSTTIVPWWSPRARVRRWSRSNIRICSRTTRAGTPGRRTWRRTCELADLLVNRLQVEDVGARYQGKVAYHYACHLRGLGLADEVERLLAKVDGLTYVRSTGRISAAASAARSRCVSGNLDRDGQRQSEVCPGHGGRRDGLDRAGCLMNIGGRLRRLGKQIEVLHLAELLERR